MTSSIRLQKYLALCGVASRRKSEEIILEGKVKVNGITVTELGTKINDSDEVLFDDRKIEPENKIYIVLNKPPDVLCTNSDDFNRKTIYDFVKVNAKKVFSVGRLDLQSTGLLILTNDGDFANKIIHPSSNVIKEYLIESEEKAPEKLIYEFKKGILIENILYKAHQILKTERENKLKIFLKEGKKREIRVVYKHYNVKILSLIRTGIGGLKLDNLSLKPGEYKEYSYDELYKLIFEVIENGK